MENIRKHRNIKLVTTEEKYLRTAMKPNFKSGVLFGENLMGCEMGKIKVVMNKLVYLGQVILDLSKIVMYEFHYNYMVPKYGLEKLKLCYMVCTFHSSLDMHDAAHTMMISDITTSAWLIDFCHRAI